MMDTFLGKSTSLFHRPSPSNKQSLLPWGKHQSTNANFPYTSYYVICTILSKTAVNFSTCSGLVSQRSLGDWICYKKMFALYECKSEEDGNLNKMLPSSPILRKFMHARARVQWVYTLELSKSPAFYITEHIPDNEKGIAD